MTLTEKQENALDEAEDALRALLALDGLTDVARDAIGQAQDLVDYVYWEIAEEDE